MKEIKAIAATWEDIKRLSEENERLRKRLEKQERKMRLWRGLAHNFHREFLKVENKTNDRCELG